MYINVCFRYASLHMMLSRTLWLNSLPKNMVSWVYNLVIESDVTIPVSKSSNSSFYCIPNNLYLAGYLFFLINWITIWWYWEDVCLTFFSSFSRLARRGQTVLWTALPLVHTKKIYTLENMFTRMTYENILDRNIIRGPRKVSWRALSDLTEVNML